MFERYVMSGRVMFVHMAVILLSFLFTVGAVIVAFATGGWDSETSTLESVPGSYSMVVLIVASVSLFMIHKAQRMIGYRDERLPEYPE